MAKTNRGTPDTARRTATAGTARSMGALVVSKPTRPKELIQNVQARDVLLGRGTGPNDHIGNVRFRELVRSHLDEYVKLSVRGDKTKMARQVVRIVQSNDGRFLRKIDGDELAGLRERSAVVLPQPNNAGSPDTSHNDSFNRFRDVYMVIEEDHVLIAKVKQAFRHLTRNPRSQRTSRPPCGKNRPDRSSAHRRAVSKTASSESPPAASPKNPPTQSSKATAAAPSDPQRETATDRVHSPDLEGTDGLRKTPTPTTTHNSFGVRDIRGAGGYLSSPQSVIDTKIRAILQSQQHSKQFAHQVPRGADTGLMMPTSMLSHWNAQQQQQQQAEHQYRQRQLSDLLFPHPSTLSASLSLMELMKGRQGTTEKHQDSPPVRRPELHSLEWLYKTEQGSTQLRALLADRGLVGSSALNLLTQFVSRGSTNE